MLNKFLRHASRPFIAYNELLEKHPLLTKSLTSGVMYAGGDFIAQMIEYNQAKNDKSGDKSFEFSWRRIVVFFTFGNVIAGPSYHYW